MSYRSQGAFSYNDLKRMSPQELDIIVSQMEKIAQREYDAAKGSSGQTETRINPGLR